MEIANASLSFLSSFWTVVLKQISMLIGKDEDEKRSKKRCKQFKWLKVFNKSSFLIRTMNIVAGKQQVLSARNNFHLIRPSLLIYSERNKSVIKAWSCPSVFRQKIQNYDTVSKFPQLFENIQNKSKSPLWKEKMSHKWSVAGRQLHQVRWSCPSKYHLTW